MKNTTSKTLLFLSATVVLIASVIVLSLAFSRSLPDHAKTPDLSSIEASVLKSMKNVDWMTESQVEEILNHAIGYDSAVIFCHADWHPTSQITRPKFAQMAARYHLSYPKQKIGFHYLDLTNVNSKPLKRIPGADGRQLPASSHLLWLRGGHLVEAKSLDMDDEIEELVESTRDITIRGITMR